MWSRETRQLVEAACEEDLGQRGDLTSALLPDASADVVARVVVRAAGAVCGLALAPTICDVFSRRLGVPFNFSAVSSDGDMLDAGTTVATLRGPHAAVLTIERTLLNFLGRMSGVATLTAQYVWAARQVNADVKILDTRKTIPGWRELDKYAVRCGGGKNHRFGLYDAILIKDNHLVGVPTDDLATFLADRLAGLSLTSTTEDGGPDDAALPRVRRGRGGQPRPARTSVPGADGGRRVIGQFLAGEDA